MLFLSTLIPRESKLSLLFFLISYYNSEGLGYFPYIQGVWGCAPTSSICRRTNRMLALNSKNLNFHFEKQSGTIIGKKILLSQHVNLEIHFCSQGIKETAAYCDSPYKFSSNLYFYIISCFFQIFITIKSILC